MGTFKDLTVYKKAFQNAMDIFRLTKSFPSDEKFSLTDQIRRSSRSVCSNLAEAYRKRQYTAHFSSKISDADMENTETLVWMDFAYECGYINSETKANIEALNSEVGKLLYHMLRYPEKYAVGKNNAEEEEGTYLTEDELRLMNND